MKAAMGPLRLVALLGRSWGWGCARPQSPLEAFDCCEEGEGTIHMIPSLGLGSDNHRLGLQVYRVRFFDTREKKNREECR